MKQIQTFIVLSIYFCGVISSTSISKVSRVKKFYEQFAWPTKSDYAQQLSQRPFELKKECAESLKMYLTSMTSGQTSALKMFDSNSKFQPGFLFDELVSFGSYDQCIEAGGTHHLYRIHWPLPINKVLMIDLNSTRLQPNHWLSRINFYHNFLYMETFIHSVCLPSHCSTYDLELLFQLNHIPVKVEFNFTDNHSAHLLNVLKYMSRSTVLLLICCTLLATFGQNFCPRALSYFNAYSNTREILKSSSNGDATRLTFLNGIRFIYFLVNVYSHFAITMIFHMPYIHSKLPRKVAKSGHLEGHVVSLGATYIGISFVMGGIVHVFSYTLKLKSSAGKLEHFIKFAMNRILRTLPVLLFVIVLVFVSPPGSGPIFEHSLTNKTLCCLKNTIYDLTFTQSEIVKIQESCMGHAFYLGVDLAFYLASYLLIPALAYNTWKGKTVAIALIPVGMVWQGLVIWNKNMPAIFNPNVIDLRRYTDSTLVHINLHNYISSYAIGLLVGILFAHKYELKGQFARLFGWFVGIASLIVPVLIMDNVDMSNHRNEIIVGSVMRTIMSLSFAILCYMAWLDNQSTLICRFLSSRCFEILGKLSYSTFSAHFLLIWYDSYQMHEPIDYRPLALTLRWTWTIATSYVLGYACYILVESPFTKYTRDLLSPKKAAIK